MTRKVLNFHLLTKIKTKMRIEEGSLTFLVIHKAEKTEKSEV